MHTHMEAELSAVLVEGKAEDGGGATPERPAAISIPLVLLEQLEVLQEHQTVSQHHHTQLLQVGLLRTGGGERGEGERGRNGK